MIIFLLLVFVAKPKNYCHYFKYYDEKMRSSSMYVAVNNFISDQCRLQSFEPFNKIDFFLQILENNSPFKILVYINSTQTAENRIAGSQREPT